VVPDASDHIERLTAADAADGLALSTEAGWNQTEADWTLLLDVGIGFGIRSGAGRVIATSLALPYPPDFGWVSLVLVHAPYRRRGLATRLMGRAVDALRTAGLVPMLDATVAGRAVYTTLGFADVERINRWRGVDGTTVDTVSDVVDFAAVSDLDASAFGADRTRLLGAIARRPENRIVLIEGGYALIRHGRTAAQIGPIVATTPEASVHLFRLAVQQTAGPIVLDVPERAQMLSTTLEETGFAIERPLIRMSHGRSQSFGSPSLVAAIAGPELG